MDRSPQAPVTDKAPLIAYLDAGCKPATQWRAGVEHEKFVCRKQDLCPAPYYGAEGIGELLWRLRQFGWQGRDEKSSLIKLARGHETVSLEPAGQLEHAGEPHADIHAVDRSVRQHLEEAVTIADELNLVLLGGGFESLYPPQINNWIPQERFNIMRAYMPHVGRAGLDMMQRTASIQVSLDYSDEKDMVRKYRVALALQPLVIALFANSPFAQGRETGYLSYRSFVWQHTDSERCGLPDFVFDDSMGFERYVDWSLDVPMYSIERNGHHIDTAGSSFRDFMRGKLEALPGEVPTLKDWQDHLQTLTPEVRLKQLLELRGADGGPPPMAAALAALWVGLLYDEQSLLGADNLIRAWPRDTRRSLYEGAARHGLASRIGGLHLKEIAQVVLDLAATGLARRHRTNSRGQDESIYLQPLYAIAREGHCQATQMLWDADAKTAVSRYWTLERPATFST